METASFQFVIFGLVVALLSNVSRRPILRSLVLLSASLVFLAQLSHNVFLLIPMAGFLLLGYAGVALLQRGLSRWIPWIVLPVLFAYIWLKKYTFLPLAILPHFSFFTLGLSYIFFRVLHLFIETGDSSEERHVGFGAYLLYTLNFTTLISGPIQRYDEFARDQFAEKPVELGPRVIGRQLERIVRGFFKVNILAMLLDLFRVNALAQINQSVSLPILLFAAFRLAIVYPFFLYANFSGYIDIVIALARLMRVRLPENFDRPFSASSFLDFWSRWHMTLSGWFKAYLYSPLLLALMRRFPSLSLQPFLGVFCFFVTFFLVGIWHGRTSEFIFYGVLQGAGVSVNKLWQIGLERVMGRKGYKELAKKPIYIAFGRGLTFSWFALTLFWLWANWQQLDSIFTAIGWMHWLCIWLVIWLCATVTLAFWERLRATLLSIRTAEGALLTNRYSLVVCMSVFGFVTYIVTVLLNQPAPDIVYKAF